MSNKQQALDSLGQLIITGVAGHELSDDSAAFLSQAGIGGVIFFAHNYQSPGQLVEFTNQIQECRSQLPLWISVDQEGGKVQRFKKPFTKIPEARLIGDLDSPKLAFDFFEAIAKELNCVGINLNFAPVADISTNPKNPVIGNRSFGETEEQVSKLVTAVVRGHLTNHVQPCVKHFPGHGDTTVDSHYALPKIDTPLEVLREREFKPFTKAFKAKCKMVMMAHILLPHLDPKFPATLSPKIIKELLREELRYTGLILSDDMEMKAITDYYGVNEAPVQAIKAGCDLLIYRTEAAARTAYESLKRALENGDLDPNRVLDAAQRSMDLKEESLMPYHPAQMDLIESSVGLAATRDLALKFDPSIKE